MNYSMNNSIYFINNFNYLNNFKNCHMISNNSLKKNNTSPSKNFSIWMRIWPKIFFTTTFFLIFDIEIAMTLPMILIINYSNLMMWTLTSIIFIIILLLGLYHEWSHGMLNWSK